MNSSLVKNPADCRPTTESYCWSTVDSEYLTSYLPPPLSKQLPMIMTRKRGRGVWACAPTRRFSVTGSLWFFEASRDPLEGGPRGVIYRSARDINIQLTS